MQRNFKLLLGALSMMALGYPCSEVAAADGTSAEVKASSTRLVLLGTAGGPTIRANRSLISSLLIVGDKTYLIDCGEGTVRQLKRAGYEASDIHHLFLSHLHFDHTAGLASMIAFGWSLSSNAELNIVGPPGTRALADRAMGYSSLSEEIFGREVPGRPSMAGTVHVNEIGQLRREPTLIYQDANVRVLAVENSHFGPIGDADFSFGKAKSYSFRFETADRVVVFTGDTGPSAAVEQLATGADILVSEVMDIEGTIAVFRARTKMPESALVALDAQMRAKHLSPDEVGKLASRAKVKMVVLSHIAPADDAERSALPYVEGVRRNYTGVVVLGRDLDEF